MVTIEPMKKRTAVDGEFPIPPEATGQSDAGGVDGESHDKMSSQTVLRDPRDAVSLVEFMLIQATLDHVPTEQALAADQATDGGEGPASSLGSDQAEADEEGEGEEEAEADDSSHDPMGPFPEENLLELFHPHAMVQQLELRRGPGSIP